MLSIRWDVLNTACFCSFTGFSVTFPDIALKPRTHHSCSMPDLSSPFPADSWHCTSVTCFLLLPWQAWCWLLCRHQSALIYILRLCHSASHLGPKCKPCLMCHAHECHFKRLHVHACVWALSLFCPCSMKCWLPVLCFHVHLFEHPPCNQRSGNKMLKRLAGIFTLMLTWVRLRSDFLLISAQPSALTISITAGNHKHFIALKTELKLGEVGHHQSWSVTPLSFSLSFRLIPVMKHLSNFSN